MTEDVLLVLLACLIVLSLVFGVLVHWRGSARWFVQAGLCVATFLIYGFILANAPPFLGPFLVGAFFVVTILPAVLGWGGVVLYRRFRGRGGVDARDG